MLRAGAVAALGSLAGCLPSGGDGPPTAAIGVRTEALATGLEVPWDLAFDPEGRLYVTERPGRVSVLAGGEVERIATPFGTAAVGEGGLLGVALHPSFPDPPWVYLYQTYRRGGDLRNRILRFRRVEGGLADREVILSSIPGAGIHDGGRLAFGPDGKLYATAGDASRSSLARDRSSLAGTVLRLNPDGSVPGDNPFGSPVWTYGHRNPEGLAFHPGSGVPLATEHGSSGHDEVNRIERGADYGWPAVTGKGGAPEYVDPVLESGDGTWAPSGATVYGGDRFHDWRGDLLFATLGFTPGGGRRSLHRVAFESPEARRVRSHEALLADEFGRLRAVAEGPDGDLRVATSNRDGRGSPAETDDRILRVSPEG